MNAVELCALIDLPAEVTREVEQYLKTRSRVIDAPLKAQLLGRSTWDGAVKQIGERIGADEHGFYILAELLLVACGTYELYRERGIAKEIFVRTMAFCTRFIKRHRALYGEYVFEWAWWLPRQLSMQEFRVKELEFELVDGGRKSVSVHIPSDADLRPVRLKETFDAFRRFLKAYYPDWMSAEWYCESWLLSPALFSLLDEGSNILFFNRLFEVEFVDWESTAVLDWVFPGRRVAPSDLAEETSLQRRMKKFLLEGGKVGWAKGRFKGEI